MANDGLNEAPALMAADVSMAPASAAVGKRGSETSTSPPILNCTLNRSGSQQQIRRSAAAERRTKPDIVR